MNNSILAKKIEDAVQKRGTIILSFKYNDKKRNVTCGARIKEGFDKRKSSLNGKGVRWGATEGPRACIQTKGNGEAKKYYLRGFENFTPDGASDTPTGFKVFDLDKIEKLKGLK